MANDKNKTGKKSLDKLAADPRIVEVWDEGEDGMWAELANGWIWDEVHTLHEHTVKDLLNAYKQIRPEFAPSQMSHSPHVFKAGRGRPTPNSKCQM